MTDVPPDRPTNGRDRDAAGRALNARPRDELGRPLAYGSAGVARAPEGQHRTATETLRQADELLRAGRPFHAHEVFEDAWKASTEPERALWRGLAQLAVGLTHLARGYPDRAARLLDRGAQSLSRYRDLTANDEPPNYADTNPAREDSSLPLNWPPIDLDGVRQWAIRAVEACTDTTSATALTLPPIPLNPRRTD